MILMKAATILMTVLGINLVHEFHVSSCDINLNTKTQVLEFTHRIFADDLENILKTNHSGVDVMSKEHYKKNNELFSEYIKTNLKIVSNKEKLNIQWIGYELKSDQIVCYFEVKLADDSKEITISNTVLMDLFKDQKNIVHWKKNNENVNSVILDRKKSSINQKF